MKRICESRGYTLYTATNDEICRGSKEDKTGLYIATGRAFRKILKEGGKYGDPITAGNVLQFDRLGMNPGIGCGFFLNSSVLNEKTINACAELFRVGQEATPDKYLYADDSKIEKLLNTVFYSVEDPHKLVYFAMHKWLTLANAGKKYEG